MALDDPPLDDRRQVGRAAQPLPSELDRERVLGALPDEPPFRTCQRGHGVGDVLASGRAVVD